MNQKTAIFSQPVSFQISIQHVSGALGLPTACAVCMQTSVITHRPYFSRLYVWEYRNKRWLHGLRALLFGTPHDPRQINLLFVRPFQIANALRVVHLHYFNNKWSRCEQSIRLRTEKKLSNVWIGRLLLWHRGWAFKCPRNANLVFWRCE